MAVGHSSAEYNRAWAESNREKRRAYHAAYYSAKPNNVQTRAYQLANPGKVNAWAAKRRASVLRATPVWADLTAIREFYERCPPGFDVDHAVPLKGGVVCGLHVLENLRYLSHVENIRRPRRYVSG